MLPAVTLFLLLAQPSQHPGPAHSAILPRLRAAVDQVEQDSNAMRFERRAPRTLTAQWQQIQRWMQPDTVGYVDLAFALAYYHVDYARNMGRLLAPYRRWRAALPDDARRRLQSTPGGRRQMERDERSVEELPYDLALIYGKNQDRRPLEALLDLKLDAHPGEQQAEVLHKLWFGHRRLLLSLAGASKGRQEVLATAIDLSYDDQAIPGRQAYRREMEAIWRFADDPDPIVAAGARGVLNASR